MNTVEQPYRILVIDDTPTIHDDFRKVLGAAANMSNAAALDDMESQLFGEPAAVTDDVARFEIDSAYQGKQGLEMLQAAIAEGRPYAMAFVDMRMPPGWDGVETIRQLWKVAPSLQVVICTAYSDYTPDQIAGELKLDGRMLIIRKPFDHAEVRQFAAALCSKWKLAQSKLELERVIEARTAEFKHAALHDAVTRLPNRVLFTDRLNQLLQQSRRDPSRRFAVLFIDLDNFKIVNDSLGHAAGDALLLQAADRLTHCVRSGDTVTREESPDDGMESVTARFGGDEFAILLDNVRSDADAARVAQRLLDASDKPYLINGQKVRCGMSVGLTTSSVGYEKPETMLRDADTAMYHAKRAGRGRFIMFDERMHAEAIARLTFESDLRTAVQEGQIQVHYQPIMSTNKGVISGFEALARWQHPTRGMISPADFIPIAEETGMILQLGLHVLETACRQLVAWQKERPGMDQLTMSVNLSRKQLAMPSLAAEIQRVIQETGIRPQFLKLELTESCVMSDTQGALAALKAIQALDVQLHIDDFGTGYSSLSCLQMFPLSGLKIDRSFVKAIHETPQKDALLRAIVALARSLKIELVSEGVETQEQVTTLTSLGCDLVQGFLFAKPMDATAAGMFIDRMEQQRTAA